jgi:hypothetical protein
VLAVALASAALAGNPDPRRFLRVDARHRIVDVTLVAGYDGTNNGFNFDGYARGELMWTVPRGWRVRVTCTNRGALRDSCAVVSGPFASAPAFPGAATPQPLVGLLHGQTARFTFRASRAGVFRFTSLVPGHEEARMYDILKVVPGGKPTVTDLFAKG